MDAYDHGVLHRASTSEGGACTPRVVAFDTRCCGRKAKGGNGGRCALDWGTAPTRGCSLVCPLTPRVAILFCAVHLFLVWSESSGTVERGC